MKRQVRKYSVLVCMTIWFQRDRFGIVSYFDMLHFIFSEFSKFPNTKHCFWGLSKEMRMKIKALEVRQGPSNG